MNLKISNRLLTLLALLCPMLVYAQVTSPADAAIRPDSIWEKSYLQRLQRLADRHAVWPIEYPPGDADAGKRAWPALLANMWKDRHDTTALRAWIDGKGRDCLFDNVIGSFYKPFSCAGYCLYYFSYKNLVPADQLEQVRRMMGQTGWRYCTRPDHYMDPIYAITEFNSENFDWMARLAGLMFAYEFDQQTYISYFSDYADNWVRVLYHCGRLEWDSQNYFAYCFQPVLVLYEYAPTPKIKQQAQAVLDWMLITAALHYLDGFQVGPDVRAKSYAYQPFSGSAWFYTYLYYVGPEYHPSFAAEKAIQNASANFIGYPLYSSYRPPQVAIDLAQRKFQTPVEMHNAKPYYGLDFNNYQDWNGKSVNSRRFAFETLYLERNYTLGSVATYRPDGNARMKTQGQMMFSEQSVWRLGVLGDDNGCLQIFGNAGALEGMAGRCPQEEIGQDRNVLMRLIRGTDRMWVAIPQQRPVLFHSDTAFVDMGHGVYVAFIPHRAQSLIVDRFSSSHLKLTWYFSATELGGLVTEVGTEQEHGSYSSFIRKVRKTTYLSSLDSDQLEYRSTSGRRLRMQYQPTTRYVLIDGTVIDPAGVVPRVWVEEGELDFENWQSYQVCYGEDIVHQDWGSGVLTAQCQNRGLRISVSPHTAEVSYERIGHYSTGVAPRTGARNTDKPLKLYGYPNPFNHSITIVFELQTGDPYELKIYDLLGRMLFQRSGESHRPGPQSLTWSATENCGSIFFCTLKTNQQSETIKLALIK